MARRCECGFACSVSLITEFAVGELVIANQGNCAGYLNLPFTVNAAGFRRHGELPLRSTAKYGTR